MPAKKIIKPQIDPVIRPVEPTLPAQESEAAAPAFRPASYDLPRDMAPGDEHTWGMMAHLSTILNPVTGFAGPIAALVIYMIYKDRSRYVAYHALQSFVFQLIWWYGGGLLIGVMWAIVGALSAILIGLVLIPFALVFTLVFALLPLGAVIYGVIGAIQTSQGRDFKYWLVGDWVRGTLTGV